jgi:hypothetical protein
VPHSAVAIEDTVDLDIFCPPPIGSAGRMPTCVSSPYVPSSRLCAMAARTN